MKLRSYLKSLAKRKDLESIQEYIRRSFFDEEVCRDQLRCLWTAYCLRYNLDVDTIIYDNDLLSLWKKMENADNGGEPDTAWWSDFDSFDLFMGELLC